VTTVASRTFRSTPQRDAQATWLAIVDLLMCGSNGNVRDQLTAVSYVAACIIADHFPMDAAITVTGDGRQTRIYCVYDEDAIDGSGANEDPLGFDPLQGNWHLSLPCSVDDLAWVQSALKSHGTRVTAHDFSIPAARSNLDNAAKLTGLQFDPKGFLGS
jgi:hypothetical protein